MKAIDVHRLLGLILMGIGLLLGVFYFSGQLTPSGMPTPQPNYGLLVPTSIGSMPINVAVARVIPTGTAAATIVIEATDTPSAPTSTITPTRIRATTMAATKSATSTRQATTAATSTSTVQPKPTNTRSASMFTATPAPIPPAASIVQASYTLRQRVGLSVPLPDRAGKPLGELHPGWYLNWNTSRSPGRPGGAEYAQTVRIPRGAIVPDLATITQIAQKNPGALWLIGNEMDVIWQDNATPEQYVAAYHDVYATLKQADPTSRVAIGGVSEPSPLRLQYLDRVLQAYRQRYGQDIPIDVWNVHNFILPEQRGSWGVDIPPGIAASSGLNYQIDDNDNLTYFKQQLIDFRRWMAQHGYRDKELIVSEYGIMMYPDYGFNYERVRHFMLGSFDVMLNTTDAELGLPADGNRLVQRWCWYSLTDVDYPTGNLADVNTKVLTPLGNDFKAYLDR